MSEQGMPKDWRTAPRPYKCKHFKWTSWRHYGVMMPEMACKLKGGEMGSCQGICEKYSPKYSPKEEIE